MEKIDTIQMRDETTIPDDIVLSGILGDSFPAYQALIQLFDDNQLTHGWRYYKDGKAWLCKVQKKDKTIVWMSAWKGYAQATIYIPEKHMDRVDALEISEERKEKFRQAKNMGKSRACTFEIRTVDVLDDFKKVMQVKFTIK